MGVPAGASPPRIICRLPRLDDAEIAKALDAGAAGLICPMVNSAEQAEALVHAAHFPPEGRRSFGPHRTAWVCASVRVREELSFFRRILL